MILTKQSDPTMNPARLKRLISGLQAGQLTIWRAVQLDDVQGELTRIAATLYEKSTTADGQDGKVDEMSVVLGI